MKLFSHAGNECTLSRVKVVKLRMALYHCVSCCVFLKNNVVANKTSYLYLLSSVSILVMFL